MITPDKWKDGARNTTGKRYYILQHHFNGNNKKIKDGRSSLAIMYVSRTLMSYLVLPRNGEESLNKFLSADPDLDHLRGGSSHGYAPSCVKN